MNKKHFTLIELLVVIGIIAILSAILLPVLSGAAKKADMSKARSEISTLVNAIKQYESVYGVLPVPTGWKDGDTHEHEVLDEDAYCWLIKVLQAQDLTASEEGYGRLEVVNSRRQKFLDIVGNNAGEYLDPWDEPYKVFLDSDYDGIIRRSSIDKTDEKFIEGVANLPEKGFPDATGNRDYVNFSVVVWSAGPDTNFKYPPSDKKTNRDNIYSFPTLWTKDGHNISR